MESVQEGPWNNLSLGKKVALAIGISAGATVGYIVYRRIRSGAAVTKASYQKTEEIRVSLPLEAYRSISRCHATFLDVVNQNSGAQVNILPDIMNQTTVTFLLRGFPDQVTVAKCALDKLVFDCEVINEVVKVPKTAFGRIIGRGGETIKLISRTSGARVNCMKDLRSILEQKGKVSIIGTRREVQTAKEMIMEKVTEDQVVRKRIFQASSQRQKRKQLENGDGLGPSSLDGQAVEMPLQVVEGPGNGKIDDVEHPEPSLDEVEEKEAASPPSEFSTFEIPSPDLSFQPDEHLEVYVSASENPEHFFIQILGVRSLQLDKLTAEMSRFYSNNTSREHRVLTIVVGDIVAAPYRECETWNRARVLGVLPSGLVDLYYVDFGDNGAFPQSNLRSMRSDFLSLPFQAIECSLAGISPAGNSWTEAALDDFDRLTYCAEWKPLLAKLCSYSHSEDSFWPSIKLFDNSQGTNTDVGEEMIRLGHAVPCKDYGGILPDDPLSLQRMLADMTSATSELSLSCISLSEAASTSESVDDALEDELI
ncbi:tudor and KH domain-containing protein isoform X1 [Denticeps clupeoides]|uniref:Tudor domain-containing protein n=1 Tax=Denticeps clupeoides TaxID=299321 RepID=A0AAY4A2V3_9TELE|nr:tudor and KH domain-containing protein isoform X1 [Denticeps clupeoides]